MIADTAPYIHPMLKEKLCKLNEYIIKAEIRNSNEDEDENASETTKDSEWKESDKIAFNIHFTLFY